MASQNISQSTVLVLTNSTQRTARIDLAVHHINLWANLSTPDVRVIAQKGIMVQERRVNAVVACHFALYQPFIDYTTNEELGYG